MNAPHAPVSIAEGVWWVGALDPDLRVFDVVMETKHGTSYNAYIVQGTEKTALIDGVKDGFLPQTLERISQVCDPASIDYIVVQHTEPDHSGAIAELMQLAPKAEIYCSKPASLFLPLIANRELPVHPVKDGDELPLGGRTLKFILAPFLHWLDTMFTFDDLSGTLFTCDAFGAHFSSEAVLESRTDPAFRESRRYYWDCIMAPFAPYAAKAVKHLDELNLPKIATVAPSHGPVLDSDPMEAVELYREWAAESGKNPIPRAFVGYVSCYGYTRRMAEALADALQGAGYVVRMEDLSQISPEEAGGAIARSDVVALGSPTVNADALPPLWIALSHVPVPLVKGKKALLFGSYGWSGEAVPMLEQRLTGLGFQVRGTYRHRFQPDAKALQEVRALVDKLA